MTAVRFILLVAGLSLIVKRIGVAFEAAVFVWVAAWCVVGLVRALDGWIEKVMKK